MTHIT